MTTHQERLEAYAELAVRIGVNLQTGQGLHVRASTDDKEFVRLVAEKAYDAGAKTVYVEWNDPYLDRTALLRSPLDALSEYPQCIPDGRVSMAREDFAFLVIQAPRPGFLHDVPTDRMTAQTRASQQALREYAEYTRSDRVAWSAIAVPTTEWADLVFAKAPQEERMDRLWNAIFRVTRVTQSHPRQAWKEHVDNLQNRVTALNHAHYESLHYTGPGTDLTVELPKNHLWVGGGATSDNGVFFVPNIPTEECFTAPLRSGVSGVVSSTKPLVFAGKVIDEFSLRLEQGRIVEYRAERGQDVLESIIETDEGAHYFGEIALVPHNSPVSQEGVVFYNTLFDENAACHIAIGNAYSINVENGPTLSPDEQMAAGLNRSQVHVDFMIGSERLDIDAKTTTGETVPLFRRGEWV